MCSERQVIHQAFRFELDPSREQRVLLSKSVGASRFVYNWGLAESRRELALTGRRPTLGQLKARLVELKKNVCPWLYEISAHIGQSALRDLDSAFEHFFEGADGPERYGHPRFKRKGERDSARLYEVSLEERHIRLPKIGRVRLKETRAERGFDGRTVSATIRRRADRWFVSLAVEREWQLVPARAIRSRREIVGVDLGLTTAAVIYDGAATQMIRPRQALRKQLKKLRRLDRQLARKRRGSRNYQKAKLRRSRLYYRTACQRSDFLHQLSSSLAKTKSVIVLEDLNVRGMARNRNLALSVGDASFGELRRQLSYKSNWYGSRIVFADRYFASSKTCSRCGVVKATLRLSERQFDCDTCGLVLDRDANASINLRGYGLALLAAELPEGLREVTPVETMALTSAVHEEVKPSSAKQDATADGRGHPTRRSTRKHVLIRSEMGSTVPFRVRIPG